ncbi:3-carboxy-cis,cis-muconate cycloisomerase [Devosia enhydra]|uniref:3-carboxy-cis,cis-muconate cycloisomerase n=1 Tax=Devosia enhydra TaxID=665118 RepID=A0A1K2HYQ0_9HYPH|nr:3-carboxy-cis,cis-muconate cycloisomerase [Devosia enhydra]SFZ84763.1 3-carboxy-cis,cis-muconate cycloisomerase [Devosia enhydra]
MSLSAFDHPILSAMLGDPEIAALFSVEAEIGALLRFERALAEVQAGLGLIPGEAADGIARAIEGFVPDIAALARGAARDGVVIPALLVQLRERLEPRHRQWLHWGATSQDAIDTGLVLRLKPALAHLDARLGAVIAALETLERRFGARPIMGRTRMQDALPIPAGHRIAAWRGPLERLSERLPAIGQAVLRVQLGGPVGTLESAGGKAEALRQGLAGALDLKASPRSWQAERDGLVGLALWLAEVSASLGKLGQDMALMALDGSLAIAGGGGSSAMAHKANPVRAELLVSLARYNGALAPAMLAAMTNEFERSGATWTLEWLTLPQMLATTGGGLRLAGELVGQVTRIGTEGERDDG